MKKFTVTYKTFGDEALLIEWPSKIDEEILSNILSFQKEIERTLPEEIEETLNTYNSLAVFFNPEIVSYVKLLESVKQLRKGEQIADPHSRNVWEIPVCYDPFFGIDLEAISKTKKIPIDELTELHLGNTYTVYFTGFLPGFLYLGGLSEKLFIPRKETPRPKILKGAVAIGGHQTGIYPQESPGGWNIIGNCPIPLFDVRKNPPTKIHAGDKIKFISISKEEHWLLKKKIDSGDFVLKALHI